MLALTRKRNESIILAVGDVTVGVNVVDIDRGKVRLGIEASQEVQIFRAELIKDGIVPKLYRKSAPDTPPIVPPLPLTTSDGGACV